MIEIITIKKDDETLLKSCEKVGSLSLPIYYHPILFLNFE